MMYETHHRNWNTSDLCVFTVKQIVNITKSSIFPSLKFTAWLTQSYSQAFPGGLTVLLLWLSLEMLPKEAIIDHYLDSFFCGLW